MYNDIVDVYNEIFPLNRAFLTFIPEYLGGPGSKVLDLGCGPGDYVDELSRFQYDVTGIDSSSGMIRHAKEVKKGTFYNYSFTDIGKLKGPYDFAFCIGNSLSYLPHKLVGPFFKDIYKLINNNGHLLIQVVNWDKYRQTGTMEFNVETLADGSTFHRAYEDTGQSTVIFHTAIKKDGGVLNSWSDTLFPKYLDDMRKHITETGMTMIEVFGDFEKSPFDPPTSPATIMIVQK
jgi:SAM-dependent methyltransferase